MRINFQTIFSGFIILLVISSCTKRPSTVLSNNEMTLIIVELHKLDGALDAKGIDPTNERERIYYYNALLKKFSVSKAEFDSSLVWYAKNPKYFDRIYRDVIIELTKLDEQAKNGYFHPVNYALLRNTKVSIWPHTRTRYNLSKDSMPNQINFTIKSGNLAWNDQYKLSFLNRTGKSNASANQNAVIRIHYAHNVCDSIVCKTSNDSLLRRYTITMKARRKLRIDSITGALINYKAVKGRFNVFIDSVKLVRKYDALAQDSIKNMLTQLESPETRLQIKPTLRLRSKVLINQRGE